MQICKEIQISEDLKILALFSDLQYSVLSAPKIAWKVSQHFLAERSEDLCVSAWMMHVDTLCKPFWSTEKWNISNLKKVSDSCGSQDSGTIFRFGIFHF